MASDPALEDLEKQLREVNRRLADTQREARGAADSVGTIGEKARVSVGGVRDAAEALTGLRLSLAGASQALVDWAVQVPEGAARAERHQQALNQLGGAYDAVATATQGAVSAEQAAGVQQRAAQAGLRLTAQELAAVTQRARDYARATGTELGQALDQLTDQLVDPGEELRKFGIFLQTGMQAGDAMRETLRQITAQAEATSPAVQSLAESQEAFHRATQEVSDALSAQVAQAVGLQSFYQNLTTWFTDAAQSGRALDVILEGIVGTMTEMAPSALGLRSSIDVQRNQSAQGAFTSAVGEQLTRIRAAGVNLGGGLRPEELSSLTEQERSRVLGLLRTRAERATQMRGSGGIPAALQGGGGLFAADSRGFEFDEIERIVKAANERATAAARSASAGRQAEITRRNRAATSASAGSSEAARTPDYWALAAAERHADPSGLALLFGGATREVQQRDTRLAREFEGVTTQRASSEARIGAGVDLGGGSAAADRVRVIREQIEGLRQLAGEAERTENTMRSMGADTNAVMAQRVAIQNALAQATGDLSNATRALTEETDTLSKRQEFALERISELVGALGGNFVDAIYAAADAADDGAKAFAQAFEDGVRSTLRSLAKQAVVEALKETAYGLGALAFGAVPKATQHFNSAAMWGVTAAAAGLGSLAMGAQPNRSAPASASAGARDTGARTDRGARADRDAGGGPLVLNINVSGAAFTDAGVHQAVAGSLREAIGSGYLTRNDLSGVLGG